jgi:hypothetical protein
MFPFKQMKRSLSHAERGQTLPFQVFGILAMLSSAFLIYDWSMVVRLQIAAQSEADAAAQLAVIPQVTQLNELSLSLYSANVEEYRLRSLLNGLLVTIHGSGGCDPDPVPIAGSTFPAPEIYQNCVANYPAMRNAYLASVARYTDDVQLVESVGDVTTGDQLSATNLMLTKLKAICASTKGCDYQYFLNSYAARSNLGTMSADAVEYKGTGFDHGGKSNPNPALVPHTADITVCKQVKGILPSLFGVSFGPVAVYARSAATPIAVTQEWFVPGLTNNPKTGYPYQRNEFWESNLVLDKNGFDSNEVHYSGNPETADPINGAFDQLISNDAGEFSAYVNWWGTALVHASTTTNTAAAAACGVS